MPQKAKKFKSALKSAAKLRVGKGGTGSGRAGISPLPGENPLVVLRLQVLSCKDLLAKDRNGFSDPYVLFSVHSIIAIHC
jgi:phosphatidylserine decarboxylase